MKVTKKENPRNDNSNIQAETLIDLALTDEQANETKGGEYKATPKLILFCADGEHF
jgi:hypothetical protein